MAWLELKIHPPVLWLLCALPAYFGEFAGLNSPMVLVAGLLVLIASALGVLGLVQFRQEQTTFHPHHPEQSAALVTTGVYRISRNPMYLGLLLMLIALYLSVQSLLGLLFVPLFVVWLSRFQIQVEERVLAKTFGQTYLDYCERVRRWL